MPMRCLWCAVATSALAVAVSGLAGCSEGPQSAPPPAPVPGGDVTPAPAPMGIPKPGKAAPGASASPSAPAATVPAAPVAATPAGGAATAPAVKGPTEQGPPKGKVPTKLQGKSPPAPEPL